MKILPLLLLAGLGASPARASSDAELRALLEQVGRAVADPAPDADRAAAAAALRRALAALEGDPVRRGGSRRADQADACVAIGVKAYAKTLYPAPALERAVEQCRGPVDAEVVAFAFPIYAETLYDAPAFEAAATLGRRPELLGKADLLEQATTAYREQSYARQALERAAALVAELPPDAGPCLRRSYATYRESRYAGAAVEQAAKTCR